MPPKLVALVEDEVDILELLEAHLHQALFRTSKYEDGTSFLASISKEVPDLVILDLMLPDIDGLEICKILKKETKWANIPILMLTARSTETDKVVGLEVGADDYVTKPFSPVEVVARVKALLRRVLPRMSGKVIRIGNIVIDPSQHQVVVQGKRVNLTRSEFHILHLLASHPGRVFTRQQILDVLWGQEKAVIDRTVDVHMMNLRHKLGPAGKRLSSVHGVGYKMEEV